MVIPTKLHHNFSQNYSSLQAELSQTIQKGMKKHKVVGMSVALVDNDKIVWAEGFGYADKENNRLADANTLYKVGSITKVFTAISVMQLVEKGLLDLNTPIQQYIPELSIKTHQPTNEAITLRHLMSHTSGLPVDKMAGMFSKNPEHFSVTIDFLNNTHAPYAPGTIATYSNVGMDLIGLIIERVTGQPFEEYVRENLLTPIGMNNSVLREDDANPTHMSLSYKKGKFHEEYKIRNVPAGNLHSNVLEMGNFIRSVLNKNDGLISNESFEEMSRLQTENTVFDSGAKFGLNWYLNNPKLDYAGTFLGHSGGTMNFVSSLMILPEKKLGVIVTANSAMQIQFIEETAVQIHQKAVHIKYGISPPSPTIRAALTTPPKEVIAESLGEFVTPLGPAKIEQDEKGMFAIVLGKKVRLNYHQDGWFSLKYKIFGLIPLPIPGLNNIRIQIQEVANEKLLYVEEQGVRYLTGKTFKANLTSDTWRSRLGKYKVDYPDGDYPWVDQVDLIEKNGVISFVIKDRQFGGSAFVINPLNDEMAIIEGIGRAAQETIYAKGSDTNSELFYSGYRLYKVF